MAKELTGDNKLFNFMYLFKNLLISYGFAMVLLFIATIVVTQLMVSEEMIAVIVKAITFVSIIYGGFMAAKNNGCRGLLSGAISGLIYFVVLCCLGMLVLGKSVFSISIILSLLFSILFGAVGGIIGVNMKHKRKR